MLSPHRRLAVVLLLTTLGLTACGGLDKSTERTVDAPLPSEYVAPALPTRTGSSARTQDVDASLRATFARTQRACEASAARYTDVPMVPVTTNPDLSQWARPAPAEPGSTSTGPTKPAAETRSIAHWSTKEVTGDQGVTDQLQITVTPGKDQAPPVSLVATSVEIKPGSAPSGTYPANSFSLRLTRPADTGRGRRADTYGNIAAYTLPRPAAGKDATVRLNDDFRTVRTAMTRSKESLRAELARENAALEKAALAAVATGLTPCRVTATCHPARPDARCGNIPACTPQPLRADQKETITAAVKRDFASRRAAADRWIDAWWAQLSSAFLWDQL